MAKAPGDAIKLAIIKLFGDIFSKKKLSVLQQQ